MDTPAVATLLDGSTVPGRLTTDHAASSYGQPVFVTDAGDALDAWQIAQVSTQRQPNAYYADVLGRDLNARELLALYRADPGGETLPQWLARQSAELWGDEHDPDSDWQMYARQIETEAAAEDPEP